MATNTGSEQAPIRLPWKIFWIGLIVRILYMTLAHTYRIRLFEDHFQFGWEAGRVARALVTGYGYADPFQGHTGPTAWLPPLYTLMIAACFKLFGIYTPLSAWAVLALNSVFSALTALAVYEIAYRCFNPKVALWSGWLWALYPAALQFAVKWIWEMSLTCCLFTWIFLLALRMRDEGGGTWRQWSLFGALGGLLALNNATPTVFLPVAALWVFWGAPERRLQTLRRAIVSGLIAGALLAPWVLRNYRVMHAFIPIRSNFGAENYMGNSPWSVGFPWGTTVPLENTRILDEYRTKGEVQWSRERGDIASEWIRTHRARFWKLTALRAYMFWAGVPQPLIPHKEYVEYGREINFAFGTVAGLLGLLLAIRQKRKAAWLMAAAFLLLPLPYYMVTVQARFRHVLEPLIMILAVNLFQSAEKRTSKAT